MTTARPTPQAQIGKRTFWQELWAFRYLLRNLIARDLKVRYKSSVLGIFWSVLNPLLIVAVFTVVFNKFLGGDIYAYPIFALVGIMPWNSFQGSIMGGANSIVANDTLVNKVYFPRIILPTTIVLSNLVNLMIVMVILFVMLLVFNIGITVHAAWVPLILLAQIMFTLGLAYLFSAAQVYFRDTVQILEVGLLAGFFLTPIFYSVDQYCRTAFFGIAFDPARVMRWLNPMASIIDAYRTVLWGRWQVTQCGTADQGFLYTPPSSMGPDFILRTLVTCALVMIVGFLIFRRVEGRFAEEL